MKFSAKYNGFEFPISPLQMVQLVAQRYGYTDIDVDPMPGKTTIKATRRDGNTVNATGGSLEGACDTFCSKLVGG